jgi:hypothetical protein
MHRLRVSPAGRNKEVEERNVTISFSQSPERATATSGRVPLVYIYIYIYISKVIPVTGLAGL